MRRIHGSVDNTKIATSQKSLTLAWVTMSPKLYRWSPPSLSLPHSNNLEYVQSSSHMYLGKRHIKGD